MSHPEASAAPVPSQADRVLAGFEVPAAEAAAFDTFLHDLGYPNQRERDNAAYQMFLR